MSKLFFTFFVLLSSLFADYEAPMQIPGTTYCDSKQAYFLHKKGVKFLDVRPLAHYKRGHIKDAINIYVDALTPETLAKLIKPNEEVVVYCNGRTCSLTPEAIIKMLSWGYTHIYYYRDGYPAWKYYGYDID